MTSKSRRPPSEFTRSRRPRNSLLFLVATAVAAPLLAQAPAGGYPPNVHVVRRQSQHREIWPRRSVANTAGETPLTQINALVRQVAAYSPRELNPATRRVLLGSFITARRAYKSGKRCRAMKLLDTIPSILSADIQGRKLVGSRAAALSGSAQRVQSRILAPLGARCALRLRRVNTPPGGETASQPQPVAPASPIQFEDEGEPPLAPPGADEPPGVPQIQIEPAPIPTLAAFADMVDPVNLRQPAWLGTLAADDLRVDQRAQWRLAQDGWPIDPSVASAGDVVVYSGNSFIDVSLTGGAANSFRHFPMASLTAGVPQPDGGYGGDQDVIYDRGTDLFYLIDQSLCTEPSGACGDDLPNTALDAQGENRYRLFVAGPDDLKKKPWRWLFWDLRSQDVVAKRAFMDYPMLAVGQNALYLAANFYHPAPATESGAEVLIRIKTAQIRTLYDKWITSGGAVAKIDVEAVRQSSHTTRPVQDVATTAYFAHYEWSGAAGASNPNLYIQSVSESSTFLFSSSPPLTLKPWSTDDVSLSPDGKSVNGEAEWVVNGTLAKGELWFAWGIGRKHPTFDDLTSFPPRIRITRVPLSTPAAMSQEDYSVPGFANGFPALATNTDGEVAMVFIYGGEGLAHSQTAVMLLTEPQRAQTFAAHLRTGGGRMGDYYRIHRDGKNGRLFSAGTFIEEAGPFASGDFIRFGRGDPVPLGTLPDLKALAITRDSYSVSNLTSTPVGPFSVRMTIKPGGGTITLTRVHPAGIGPFATVSAYLPACFSGLSQATITVDPENVIKESNETNNTISGGPWACI